MWVSHSVKLSLSVPLTVTLCSPVPGWVNRSTCTDTSPTGSSTPGSSKNVQKLLIRNASKHDWFGLKPYGHLKFASFFFCCCCCRCIGLFILLFFLQLLCSFIWSAFIFSHTIPYPSLLPCFVASFLYLFPFTCSRHYTCCSSMTRLTLWSLTLYKFFDKWVSGLRVQGQCWFERL